MILAKRKEKKSSDITTVLYWQNRIKPGMKLNNHKLNHAIPYANFVVPKTYNIVKSGEAINISFMDIKGNDSWYCIYRDGISVEIIQEDIMSPKYGDEYPF